MAESTIKIDRVAGQPNELEIKGEIDYHSSGKLRKELTLLLTSRREDSLRLRLDKVEFIDSTGLSVLLDAVKTAQSNGVTITLVHPSRQLMRVLSVSGFAPFFRIDKAGEYETEIVEQEPPVDDDLLIESFEAEGRPENIAALRKSVTRFAEGLPFNKQDIDDIKLAVGEASCNALRYGCPTGTESIHITCTRRGPRFSVQITDSGPGFNPDSIPQVAEGELSEGGRGIFFMRCLMDEVKFQFSEGTTVELIKYLPSDNNASGRRNS